MAADVSRQIKNEKKSSVLITRDFLGGGETVGVAVGGSNNIDTGSGNGCFGIESKELDLDLHVPSGFEKRLDLKSGKVYIQRCSPKPTSSSSPPDHNNNNHHLHNNHNHLLFLLQATTASTTTSSAGLQDLNFPPHSKPALNLFDEPTLNLQLVSTSPPKATSTNNNRAAPLMMTTGLYQSVCTLDKVKSALDRAEKESSSYSKKRTTAAAAATTGGSSMISASSSLSPSNSSSNISVDDVGGRNGDDKLSGSTTTTILAADHHDHSNGGNSRLLVASACPGCLLYVLISKNNPKCPQCGLRIQLPVVTTKKPRIEQPRIDLNISM